MGRIANRKTAVSAFEFSIRAASAAIGAANARPQRTAANGVRIASGDENAPAMAATIANIDAATNIRAAAHASRPPTSSNTRTGVATTAWYVFTHRIPAMTGKLPSFVPICMASAAISPGATYSRYVSPPRFGFPSSMTLPRRIPIDRRKKIGFRRPVVIVARQTRRYDRAYHEKTAAAWPTGWMGSVDKRASR